MKRLITLLICLILLLAVSGCGKDKEEPKPTGDDSKETTKDNSETEPTGKDIDDLENTPSENPKFTIAFDSDGGSNITKQTVEEGGKATKPKDPTKNGFLFKEWQLSGKKYDFNNKITKDISLKAFWIKYDYNLNDNKKYEEYSTALGGSYLYPGNPECKGKYPHEITLTEGQNYDSYCQNKIPTHPNTLKGKGYSCIYNKKYMNESDFTVSGYYECEWLNEIVSSKELVEIIGKTMKTGNYLLYGEGASTETKQVTLTEALCTKYSLSCGKW